VDEDVVVAVVTSYSPLLWLVIDTTSKAYTHARPSQLPQEKQPQHNSLFVCAERVHGIAIATGVTRLDGARVKKQVWCPHVRTWGLSEANVLYWRKYLWHCWDF